jgi:hypothetical protein
MPKPESSHSGLPEHWALKRPWRRRRRTLTILAAVFATTLGVGGFGAYAAISGFSAPSGDRGAAIAAASPGPGRLVRASDLNPAAAEIAARLANGDSVGVVAGASAKCLVRIRSGQIVGEACAATADIASGEATTVTDECGSSGHQRMEITGLAPEGATAVRLVKSDGSSTATAVVDGAFKFDGTNPGPDDPYPTGVEWLDGATALGGANLPIVGGQFCLPTD